MIARTDGETQQPHFAHKFNSKCSPETYLHKLGKRLFKQAYDSFLADSQAFLLSIPHPSRCNRCHIFKTAFGDECLIQRTASGHDGLVQREWNLVSVFDNADIEAKADQFRADVLLYKSDDPERRILVEFVVSNAVSRVKRESGEKIISIKLNQESDLEFVNDAKIVIEPRQNWEGAGKFEAINFHSNIVPGVCVCKKAPWRLVVEFKNGVCKQEEGTIDYLSDWYVQRKSKVVDYRLYIGCEHPDQYLNSYCVDEDGGRTFYRAVQEIGKNCFGCRYRSESMDVHAKGWCKILRRKIQNSSDGSKCGSFTRNQAL